MKAEFNQSGYLAAALKVYANRAAFDRKEAPLEEDLVIGNLGSTKQDALIVVVPEEDSPNSTLVINDIARTNWDGIDPGKPCLARESLLCKIYKDLISDEIYSGDAPLRHIIAKRGYSDFFLLSSPAGSGKTSLLDLFKQRFRHINCIQISLNSPNSAFSLLKRAGIDVEMKTSTLTPNKFHVIMLDDAQWKYEEKDFWPAFMKKGPWYPKNVRFIIAATHSFNAKVESPVEFEAIPIRLEREDFLLTDEEAMQFLNLPNGLPSNMNYPELKNLIIRECEGLVGTLRISVDALHENFCATQSPTQQELIDYYFSGECTRRMARCFGSDHKKPSWDLLKKLLVKCFSGELIAPPQLHTLGPDEKECYSDLIKSGILTTKENKAQLVFSSPISLRYYANLFFPSRAAS